MITELPAADWDAEACAAIEGIFDVMAAGWHTRTSPVRTKVVEDALARGVPAEAPHGVASRAGPGTWCVMMRRR